MKTVIATLTIILIGVSTPTSASSDDTTPIRRADIRITTSSPTFEGGDLKLKLSHLWDGVPFSSWAGTWSKDGVWVALKFVGTRYISKVEVLPGCAGSGRVFAEYAVPRTLVLAAGGRTLTLELKYRRRTQIFRVDPPLRAETLKITATAYYPGRHRAVCMTELGLHEQTALGALDNATREKLEKHARRLSGENGMAAVVALVSMGPAAVPRLALALSEGDSLVQKRSLLALHRIGAPSAAAALIRYWKAGPPTDLRELALEAMARTGHNDVIPLIAEIMRGKDYALADLAANTVGSFGKAMLPAIEPLLKSPYADVQERAVRAMQHIGDLRVVDLARPFCSARRSEHRAAAAHALASAPCEAAIAELETLSRDPHPHVRHAVAASLDSYPEADSNRILARLLRDPDTYVANKALDVLAGKPNGARYLASYIESENAPLGREAIMMLAQSGTSLATRIMVDALRRGDARFRRSLQDGLLAVGRPGVSALVSAALVDEGLRADAEKVLERTPELAAELVGAVVDREAGAPPVFLLRALGRSRAPGALAVLDRVWERSPPSVRLQVIRAWSNFPAAGVKGRLMAAIQDTDSLARLEAVKAAATAGVTEVGPMLAKALTDGSLPVVVAIEGLGKLESEAGVSYMTLNFRFANMRTRLAILHACNRIQSTECLQLLYTAIQDPDAHIRSESLRLLSSQ